MKKILSKIGSPKIDLVLNPAKNLGESLKSGVGEAFEKVTETFDTGVGLLQDTLGGVPFFGAMATSETYDHKSYDEKHYFLIPDVGSVEGYSIYVMRCLPAGVPPINDLKKRRLLHLPNRDALPMLEHILIKDARERAGANAKSNNFISDNLDTLINEIDKIDGKVFGGVLLLGGLVSLANPLAGAIVATKAIVPSIGLVVSKYGLKLASETATNLDISQQVKRAEKDVKKQFRSAKALVVVNPILNHLAVQTSLDMWMMESEIFQYDCDEIDFTQQDTRRLTDLTQQAISDIIRDGETQSHLDQVIEIIRGSDSQ